MITNTTAKSTYTIAAGVTAYPIGFQYAYNPDGTPQISVYIKPHPEAPLIYGTNYTISADGLSVELISGYEVGDKLVILRAIPMVQLSDYVIGRIDPEQIEHDFDEAVMRDQQLEAEIDLLESVPLDHEARLVAIEEVIPDEATPSNQLTDKDYVDTLVSNHTSRTDNPHSVTAAQVGLGNCDNTSDLDKPVSTATQTALDGKVDKNAAITGATHTKITYDSKGLVTGGSDITLSDVTDVTATATEVNTLDGITASTAELNIMDGVTATTTEINYLSGVTSAVQTQLDGKVDENAAITGATKCKITYDAKGLVTAGADIDTSDLTDVAISSVQDGEFLRYDGVAGKWKNAASTASIGFSGITGSPYDNTLLGKELNIKTNCITEVPQDIKLELNAGVLTLKAGSRCYLKTDTTTPSVSVANDLTTTQTTNGFYYVVYDGSSLTTVNYSGYDYSSLPNTYSLPLAFVRVSGNTITSIQYVFNGFGYIGSTIFVLPGVKGLIPNGYNADGTLNTTSFAVGSVLTHTVASNYVGNLYILVKSDAITCQTEYQSGYAVCGIVLYRNGVVLSFLPKHVFCSLDSSDREYVAHQATPSDFAISLSLGASGTSYTMPADGYIYFAHQAYAGQYVNISTSDEWKVFDYNEGSNMRYAYVWLPVSKGQNIRIYYTASGDNSVLRFIYANGAAKGVNNV